MEENSDDRLTQSAVAMSTPQKKMMTTSKEYQYNFSTPKDGSSRGSGNTNPNQADTDSECVLAPRSYSPFHEMWDRYSGHLQTLEEGKQMIQRRFASFLDDACAASSCQNPDIEQTTVPLSSLQEHTVDPISPGKDSAATNKALRRSPMNSVTDTSALCRSAAAGTVRGGVKIRRSLFSPQTTAVSGGGKKRDSPATVSTTYEHIEVNSEHEVRVIEASPDSIAPSKHHRSKKKAPLGLLEVRPEDAFELERSISELTMRSSYGGEALATIPDNRRMAYYAVGKNHRQSGRGGNRRCYFSGKLILGGAPFYAGAVQQGLRTLVVFCLPSALNLPDRESIIQYNQACRSSRSSSLGNDSAGGGILRDNSRGTRSVNSRSIASRSVDKRPSRRGLRGLIPNNHSLNNNDGANSVASKSRLSSLDDLSLSIDGDLDPNWGLDRDLLLRVLPEADAELLETMSSLFPEQFETLPLQVRDHTRWRLFVKFCFFSGLPIAEGEMHYKVLDELAEQVYGEEIVLSHDVMEAVNGDISAGILQLPNQKLFRYLRKHYAQQCSKLDDRVFRRNAWKRESPEV